VESAVEPHPVPVQHLPDGSYIAEVIPSARSGMVSLRMRVIEYELPDVQDGNDGLYRLDNARAPRS
jgi:hypothetical protein